MFYVPPGSKKTPGPVIKVNGTLETISSGMLQDFQEKMHCSGAPDPPPIPKSLPNFISSHTSRPSILYTECSLNITLYVLVAI